MLGRHRWSVPCSMSPVPCSLSARPVASRQSRMSSQVVISKLCMFVQALWVGCEARCMLCLWNTLTNAVTQRSEGAQTMKSKDCASRLQGKYSKPAMTHSVTPFRQNRARSALFFNRDKSAAPGSLQQFEKTVVICKGEAPLKISDGRKSAPNPVLLTYFLSATKEEE